MEQLDAKLMIRDIYARKVLDCGGNLTIETEVLAEDGGVGRVTVPSGTAYLYNDSQETDWTEKAVEAINEHIAPEVIGKNILEQEDIDRVLLSLDGTENKNALGAGAIYSVSAAAAETAAAALKMPLYRYLGGVQAKHMPVPAVNIFGKSSKSKHFPAIRNIMIIPANEQSFSEQLNVCMKVHRAVKKEIQERKVRISDMDRGEYIQTLSGRDLLRIIKAAVERAKLQMEQDLTIGIAVTASELYDSEKKCYRFSDGEKEKEHVRCMTAQEMISYYEELAAEFPITHFIDPLDMEDWDGWAELTGKMGNRVQLAGDSLFQMDVKRLEKGIRLGAANSIVVRAGQATLTEMSDVIKKAQEAGYTVGVSGNEGETADSILSDLAVAFHAGQIYAGPLCHMEYVEKYNRLLRIEEKIGETG